MPRHVLLRKLIRWSSDAVHSCLQSESSFDYINSRSPMETCLLYTFIILPRMSLLLTHAPAKAVLYTHRLHDNSIIEDETFSLNKSIVGIRWCLRQCLHWSCDDWLPLIVEVDLAHLPQEPVHLDLCLLCRVHQPVEGRLRCGRGLVPP